MALARQMEEAESARAGEAVPELQAASEADYYKDINNVYSLLTVEPIEMEFGYSLIPLVDEASRRKADQPDRHFPAAVCSGHGICDPVHPAP